MNKVHVASRRKKLNTLEREFPQSEIIDVTSKADQPWVKFSPFYPHGNIPVPFSDGVHSYSVEGLWQGLKVFDSHDVDHSKFEVKNMKGIKRTVRKYGTVLGHRKGVNGSELFSYLDARKVIYIPSYQYVLDNLVQAELDELMRILERKDVVLLDYETNANIEDLSKPLSHASLIAAHLNNSRRV